MAKAAVEPKPCVRQGDGADRAACLLYAPSHHQVFLVLTCFITVRINIQVPRLVTRRINRTIHKDKYPRGGWKGANQKMPLLQLKSYLPLSNLSRWLFFPFELVSLSFGRRQGGGKEPVFGCRGAETCQALKSSTERWDFVAGMLGLWLGMKKIGHTGSHWCQGLQAWDPAGLQIWQKGENNLCLLRIVKTSKGKCLLYSNI